MVVMHYRQDDRTVLFILIYKSQNVGDADVSMHALKRLFHILTCEIAETMGLSHFHPSPRLTQYGENDVLDTCCWSQRPHAYIHNAHLSCCVKLKFDLSENPSESIRNLVLGGKTSIRIEIIHRRQQGEELSEMREAAGQ